MDALEHVSLLSDEEFVHDGDIIRNTTLLRDVHFSLDNKILTVFFSHPFLILLIFHPVDKKILECCHFT